jgi:predicted AlkP superfamily phosphohydrolase/phosphomutase
VRSVIFGVDGLTFRILKPLIERGELPNFQKLTQEGCEAVLESKYPPLTAPAWTSLSTGLKPARHGVYDFWEYEDQQDPGKARKAAVVTHRRGGKAIWNILSEYGKQVLVINVPVTYPPETVNGVMISGYMTPGANTDFTYPAAFKEELYRVVPDYEIDITLPEIFVGKVEDRTRRLIDAAIHMTEQRMKLIMYLLNEKPWDFCYVAFVGPDRLQHPLWDEINALDPRTNAYFHLLDAALGQILDKLEPEDTLFVVSDHGFQGVRRSFDINEYLYSKGLLKLHSSADRDRSGRFADFKYMLERMGLLSLLLKAKKALKGAGIIKKKPADRLYKPALSGVDWTQTIAYVPSLSGYGGGYADIFLSPEMSQEQIAELREDLERQRDPASGKALIDVIYSTEVYGTGPFALHEPHLLLLPSEGITFNMSLGNKRLWNNVSAGRDSSKGRGSHQKEGVFYAYGGGIKRGFSAPNAEIYDLVPTVLQSMGLPFPHEFDGRALHELFVEEGRQDDPALKMDNSGAEGGLARRKLKKLLAGQVG